MLLIRPRPREDESLMGYMLRVSECNAVTSPMHLIAKVGYEVACSTHGTAVASLRGPLSFMRGTSRPDSGGVGSRFWNEASSLLPALSRRGWVLATDLGAGLRCGM